MSVVLPPPPQFGQALEIGPAPEVLSFLATRRSTSALSLTEPGPNAAQVDMLLRLAARVPDHGKLAPWRFVVLDSAGKSAFADRLDALARGRGDERAAAKLGKLKAPPMGVAVVSSPRSGEIPEWEQLMSAGAVCANLLYAAQASGFGANWITDWYAYDPEARTILGLSDAERIAGFVFIGTANAPPQERERPDPQALTTVWRP